MAPPPATTLEFFSARRTIMMASCSERSASSKNYREWMQHVKQQSIDDERQHLMKVWVTCSPWYTSYSAMVPTCSEPPRSTKVAVRALGHPVNKLYRSPPTWISDNAFSNKYQ